MDEKDNKDKGQENSRTKENKILSRDEDKKGNEDEDSDSLLFPLPFIPKESYKESPRNFGAKRDNGKRLHAGCDLYAPEGTPVFAIKKGKILLITKKFLDDTIVIAIDHQNFVVRYCELKDEELENIKEGAIVEKGQIIGHVGKLTVTSYTMLHLELYKGDIRGAFRDEHNPPYYRRKDLMDPTELLDKAAKNLKKYERR